MEGIWGAQQRGGFAAFPVGLTRATSGQKILMWARTSPDQAQEEDMWPDSLLHCLVLYRQLDKVKERGERVPWDFLSRSEHVP